MKLGRDHLLDLAEGAAFLATGGGGDPYLTYLTADAAIAAHGPVDLVSLDDLSDDAAIVAIGGVGAPTTSLELLPSIHNGIAALDAYRRITGRPVDAIVGFEIGGGNSLMPIIAAAAGGIPVIDGDGMGRALPEVQMMTYAIAGHSPTPAVAMDYAGKMRFFEQIGTGQYEDEIRHFAMTSGGMVTSVEFWMTAKELRKCIVANTVTLSIELGRILRGGHGNAMQVAAPLADVFKRSIYGQFRSLFAGTVSDISTSVIGGFDIGKSIIESNSPGGGTLTIDIKNEYLTAWLDGRLLASAPDLIAILDFESAQPVTAERLRFGQRVAVFGIGCPGHYRTERALQVVGPRCFGFDFDYCPIEVL